MDIEVVYTLRIKPEKRDPKPKGRMFVGVKMKDRWGNVYENFPLYAKDWKNLCKELEAIGYEVISTAP